MSELTAFLDTALPRQIDTETAWHHGDLDARLAAPQPARARIPVEANRVAQAGREGASVLPVGVEDHHRGPARIGFDAGIARRTHRHIEPAVRPDPQRA